MARLLRPVTRMISSRPEATASSTTYWMVGLSTRGSISLGCALVAGRKRVPSPAAGKTALRTLADDITLQCAVRPGRAQQTVCSGRGAKRSIWETAHGKSFERFVRFRSACEALSRGPSPPWADYHCGAAVLQPRSGLSYFVFSTGAPL